MLKKYLISGIILLASIYFLLLTPSGDLREPQNLSGSPFIWNQDKRWDALEARFLEIHKENPDSVRIKLDSQLENCYRLVTLLSLRQYNVNDTLFGLIEKNIFSLATMIPSCPDRLKPFMKLTGWMRASVKEQSMNWDINSTATKNRLYRLIYGSRQALEEVMLQVPHDSLLFDLMNNEEPSVTPSTMILGVKVHSGDILVSRGGAPTSALIARGSDYPGNFSHVALVYVDSGKAYIIESHIERGVVISTLNDYLQDKKLRIMVLRLKSNLKALQKDSMLPHKIAARMQNLVKSRHIPYDFAMDAHDSTKMFCSEVASQAYRQFGIELWKGISVISSKGVASWLSAFGVENFKTQEPSDLEYDPQLCVVAEWRDWETLYKDHIDNAVIDVMLEGAERGERLKYDWYMLPVARVIKAYSYVLNLIGGVGPIPEGMDATAALKNKGLTTRHLLIKNELIKNAEEFRNKNGYVPPYWELLKLARIKTN
jgi:hypothetical protein